MNQRTFSAHLNGIDVSEILGYQRIHDGLHSSGQPTVQQLELICQAGVSTVVNLALTDASNSLMHQHIHEDRVVLELGMNYIQLPLLWDRPCSNQALLILNAIHHLQQTQIVWVHCAKNWRVSSLMNLYRRFYMNTDIGQADELMRQIWQPDATWTGLMHAVAMQLQAQQFSG